MNDSRTIYPQDAAAWSRAHEPEQSRYDDVEPDEPFTMPAVDIDDDYPPLRAFLRVWGEWT